MGRVTPVLTTVVAMLGGCVNYQQSKKVAYAGGATTIVSLVVAGAGLMLLDEVIPDGAASYTCGGSSACPVVMGVTVAGIIGIPVGLALWGAGLAGMAGYPEVTEEQRAERAEQARRTEQARASARARELAWNLTKQAAESARAGDCALVGVRGREVRELDAEFYATVFVADVAIKRCLDAATGADHQPSATP